MVIKDLALAIRTIITDFDRYLSNLEKEVVIRSHNELEDLIFERVIIREEKGKLKKEEFVKTLSEILQDERVRKIVNEHGKEIKEIEKRINENKDKLLRTLKELEAYEILPGICKYLRGE